jgi:streptomycin 6-kinase
VVEVPDRVRRKALAGGPACARWLGDLGRLVTELEGKWDVTVGATMTGGTASLVAEATMADGTPAVVKLAMPHEHDGREALESEVRVLQLADGRGCVRLHAYDEAHGAVLLERLGRQLHELDLPVHEQMEIICSVLPELWAVPVGEVDLPSLADKGRWLSQFTIDTWEALDRPCSALVVDRALEYADRRVAALDPDRRVLLHGDAHAWNTLEALDASNAFKLIDADGVLGEREYDLAIPMREYADELLAGDALALGQERARFLARLTGLDEQRIWEWGYIERVSTGLLCVKQSHDDWGRDFLAVAEAWSLA